VSARILGLGYSVPSKIRTNEDPIFDWIKKHIPNGTNLFTGYVDRRVLSEGESLLTIMSPAARAAVEDAGLELSDIDLLLGTASVSHFESPNGLCRLHRELGLPSDVWVLPMANDFSNFNSCLMAADALVRAGRVKNALICVGGNWTRFVDYHTPQSISASDGAGAVVVGTSDDAGRWEFVDYETVTESKYYASMFMGPDKVDRGKGSEDFFTKPYFHITQEGINGFKEFGEAVPPQVALKLLARNGVEPADCTVISHQASSVLLEAWQKAIQPGQYIWTIEPYANMTVANIPVTLAWASANQPISQDNLLLLGIGPEMHANAVLLKRRPS
jgi:3-oxoacyl-[acyl-carrier-protein] synthase-3